MADEELKDQQTTEEPEGEATDAAEEEKNLEDKLKEAVDVQVEDLGGLRKKLTITVPHDLIGEQSDEQYSELRQEALVPGFRKGRAPRRLLEKRFGGEVKTTLLQQMLGNGYMAAVEKADLKVLGDPLILVKGKDEEGERLVDAQEAMDLLELPDDESLVFSCEVEVRPEFELPKLDGIPLEKPAITVTDEDVTKNLDRLRWMQGHFETLPEGSAVEADDAVVADVKMTSGETVLKEEEAVRLAARPQTVEGILLEKLGDVLTGSKVGDTCTAAGEIPDTYDKADFRGKEANLEIRIREIQRLRLPEINEQFVKSVGFDTEEELREWVRNDLESRINEQLNQAMAAQVYKYLLDNTKIELPERISDRQTSRVVTRKLLELYRQGVPPAEAEKQLDEMKVSAKEETARELKIHFVMEKLAEEKEIDVSEGEINGMIAAIAQRQGRRFDRVRDELAKQGGLVNIYIQLRDEKIVAELIEKADIKDVEPDKAEGTAKPKKKTTRKKSTKNKKESESESKDADESADEK